MCPPKGVDHSGRYGVAVYAPANKPHTIFADREVFSTLIDSTANQEPSNVPLLRPTKLHSGLPMVKAAK
jgi:hypothetical protein